MNEMTVRVPIRTEDKKRIFDVEVLIMGGFISTERY